MNLFVNYVGSLYLFLPIYCMSKKSWPNLYSKLLYKSGQDFFDRQYNV